MARYPVERVEAILDGKPSRVPTPTTLSGTIGTIFSYEKLIACSNSDGSWNVVERRSSRTTNRHIDAVYRVLSSRGIVVNEVPYGHRSPYTGY